MKQEADEKHLSTADMVAAAEGGGPEIETGERLVEPPEEPDTKRAPQGAGGVTETPEEVMALLAEEQAHELRTRWADVQTGFVDEPRRAVEQADALVADAMKRLAQSFANERAQLESQWSGGSNVSTEDLRLALLRYRSFFDRLRNHRRHADVPDPS
jgi:hypothetical protein